MTDMSKATDMETPTDRPSAATCGSAQYAHEWEISVRADTLNGAMDAVWAMWEAWRGNEEPLGGCNPGGVMGNRMDYLVKKTKEPMQNGQSSATATTAGVDRKGNDGKH